MTVPIEIERCCKYIDAQQNNYVEELKKIVAIDGISSDPRSHMKIANLIEWMKDRLTGLGFDVELRDAGTYTPDGADSTINIPLLLLGTLGKSRIKKTLLYYCHLDVDDVNRDSWTSNPFEMFERDGKLYGRGTARMKGPLLCFIHAIECYKILGLQLPVNVKILCESMHESGSVGIEINLKAMRSGFLSGIDCVLTNDGQWIGKDHPCIIHGFRGVCYFDVTVEGPKQDSHSGQYGGLLHEPMQDVIFLVNIILESSGRIKIPGFYDDVVQITPDEEDIYRNLKIDMTNYRDKSGLKKFAHDEKIKQTLMNVWRHPSFNLHYIENNMNCDCTTKLTIPKKINAKFSLRLVPRQSSERACRLLYRYVEKELRARCTPNDVAIKVNDQSNPWLEDHLHWNYEAAQIATRQVYKCEANLIREGNEFPTILKIREALPDKNILVLPLVNNESNAGNKDENISLRCYIESTKLITNYLHQLSVCSVKR